MRSDRRSSIDASSPDYSNPETTPAQEEEVLDTCWGRSPCAARPATIAGPGDGDFDVLGTVNT